MKKQSAAVSPRVKAWTCQSLAGLLDRTLQVSSMHDSALNGLQVEGTRPVRRVAVAVDASLAAFEAAQRVQADLLIVHHGLFWGKPFAWTGLHARRLRVLAGSGLGLYAAHLPLDAHRQLGNNAQLARALGLRHCRPFGVYHGETIGVRGEAPKAWTRAEVSERLAACLGSSPKVLPLGSARIKSLALVSGGGGDMVAEAFSAVPKVDAFVTGEASHWIYPLCQEAGLNVYLGGHYATETFGVKALGAFLEKKCGILSFFLDLPTGM